MGPGLKGDNMHIEGMRSNLLLSVLIVLLTGYACFGACPTADLDGDCWVDLKDLTAFCSYWLLPNDCEGEVCANLDGKNDVNFLDYALFASQWKTGTKVVINEFMASNNSDSGISDPQGDFDDWLELYNLGDQPINLAGMHLSDKLDDPNKWQIPTGYPTDTTIPANGFLVIWADEEPLDGPLHADFKLSADGEDILLSDANGNLIDGISFGQQTTNISYGRYPDGTETWRFFSTPTPGAENNGAYIDEVDEVEFSHTRGFYDSPFNVTLACATSGVDIYYTTDGSDPVIEEAPSPTGTQYTSALPITTSTSLRAAAIKTGWKPSRIRTHTYIFDASNAIKAMPAVFLTGDEYSSLFEPDGIMAIVGGYYYQPDPNNSPWDWVWTDGGDPEAYNNPIHRGIEFERPVSFEIVDPVDKDIQADCGIRVHGSDYTRPRYTRGEDWLCNNNKFSFNLFFRNDYGDNRFEYPFFPFTPEIDRYQSIALRGGHNDICSPFVKDEWTRRLLREMGHTQVTGTFVNLYLNGDYKYYYNPIAREDEEFFQEWYGSDNDFDVITNSGLRDGDWNEWNNLINYADSHDLSKANNYNYFAGKFDIVTFIDYIILEIHSGNFDWPGNNWTAHRERSDNGIFRFSIWDADGIAESWEFDDSNTNYCKYCYKTAFEDFPTWTSPTGLNNLPWDATSRIYRALRVNPDFRQLFADRIHKHYRNGGLLTPSHLIDKWWEVQNEVSSVLPYQSTYVPDVFLPAREPYVMAAFEENNLWDRSFSAPVFNVNSSYKYGGYVSPTDSFTITDPCSSGTIYYSTDGNDPRVSADDAGGAVLTVLAYENAAKKVLVPTSDIGTTWRGGSEPYNDSGWTSGSGGVGYERDTGIYYNPYIDIDVETAMYGNMASCYVRIPFTVDSEELSEYDTLKLRVQYDDGYVAFINGIPVHQINAPETLLWNSTSSSNHEAGATPDEFDISSYISTLQAGSNILAIHALNATTTSSDFLITAELEASGSGSGNISPSAIEYTGAFTINKSTHLKSRVYNAGQWSALNDAVYAFAPVADSIRITEIMYNPLDTNNPDDPNTEYVELTNIGDSVINLNLVKFDKGIDFTFGPYIIRPGRHLLVVKDINAFEAKYGTGKRIAGEYEGSLNDGGERLQLEDGLKTAILDFDFSDNWRYTTDGDGYSLTIINPANPDANSWGDKESWRPSAYINGSPGWDDSGIIPNPGAIVISEAMTHSHAANADWVELYNTTSNPINIAGWFLSDSDSNVMKYQFASGTTIAGHSYLVVTEDVNFGLAASDPGRLIPFALSEDGETVCLASALDANSMLTGYREREDFGAAETGVSFGRYYKASTDNYNFVPMDHNTPGSANAYPKLGPIIITEIMYHPDWPAGGSYTNDQYEFIELRNTSGSEVTLYDYVEAAPWKFTDGIDYTFPSPPDEVTIPSGGRIVVVKHPTAFSWRYPGVSSSIIYGPYDGWLDNNGEQLELGKPGDLDLFGVRQYIRVERVTYSDGSHPGSTPGDVDLWPTDADGLGDSLLRTSNTQYGNDPNNWTAATPTPGS